MSVVYNIINKVKKVFVYTFAGLFSDRKYLELFFPLNTGYQLRLDNPQTFNEKLQWLKLYNRRPEYSRMVDKIEAKDYVASIIGYEHIIPTIAVYNSVDEIDFDSLPNQFVLKCSHDSGGVVICKDKSSFNTKEAIRKLKRGLSRTYYVKNREWPYKNVIPRIIAEEYMTDDGNELKDYKVFTFGGEPKLVEIDYNRFKGHMRTVYDTDWNLVNVRIQYPTDKNRNFNKPAVLGELLDLSRKLAVGTPHLRTDFYIVNDKIYFGELTFFHGSGFEKIYPIEFDKLMGDWIILPSRTD